MADPITVATVISLVAKKVFDSLASKGAGKIADAAFAKLEGDEVKKAFQQALGEAIERYATSGTRLTLAEPLLRDDGPLSDQSIVNELAKVLRFDQEPNFELIGDRWRSALEDQPQWRDFTSEAEMLINYLKDELSASEVFGPAMERQTLEDINEKATISNQALHNIIDELNELRSMMDSPFSNLMRAIAGAIFSIQEQVRDFTWYIEDKTRDFIGRQFVFDKADAFMQNNPSGYFIVRGDPGIGKTALAAQWVKNRSSVHHFNIRSLSINRAEAFLRNICAQLIAAYDLDHQFLPADATQDGGFLIRLLDEISEKLKPDD
jgi:hypothetical protein